MTVSYLTGFGNEHATEARPGVLPSGQNSPQNVADGLFAEQLSGSAFTAPRATNLRSWLYRLRPSVRHLSDLRPIDAGLFRTAPDREHPTPASQLRWGPEPFDPDEDATWRNQTWLSSLRTIASNGDAHLQCGAATHLYAAGRSMVNETFVDSDGEMLIVPESGGVRVVTEMGVLEVQPADIVVVPRGVKFRVELMGDSARGYACENYGAPFTLPEPGLIGLNALAMPRDFRYPVAAYEGEHGDEPSRLVLKYGGNLFETELEHSPLDVVAWHGNYAPYKYNLRDYCPIGPVLFDHPDPSIWTVLTSASDTPGTANVDFVLFRERWLVAEHTFRPPWFHSNVMSELMGLIEGVYDAKLDGFAPGGVSIHNAFLPHGPDQASFERGSSESLEPRRMEPFLSFMLESRYAWLPSQWALGRPERQQNYATTWSGIDRSV